MFLYMSVILFTGAGWLSSMHNRSHDQKGGLHPEEGVCIRRPGQTPFPGTGKAGGTHSTGMLPGSELKSFSRN